MSKFVVDTFNKKVLSSYYNIFDKTAKYYNIYGYYVEKESNYIFLGSSETFHGDKGQMNMNIIGKLYTYRDNVEHCDISSKCAYNINSDNKIFRKISGKYYDLDFDNMISSDITSNMIEILNEDNTKRIQIIKSEFGFNIFYINDGNLFAYEEYYQKELPESIEVNQKNLSIIDLIIKNLVNKYNITNIAINNNDSESDDSDLSDTDREMMELGIYNMNLNDNESESSTDDNDDESDDDDDEDDDDESDDRESDENNSFIELDNLEISSSSNENSDSDSEIDSDLENILKE